VTSRILLLGQNGSSDDFVATLENAYFNVTRTSDSEGVLQSLRRENPDLLVIDGQQADRAVAVLYSLSNEISQRHAPCLLVCAADQTVLRARAVELGVDDILLRDSADVEVFSRIRSLNRLRMAREELRNREATEMLLGQTHMNRRDPLISDARIFLVADSEEAHQALAQVMPEWAAPQLANGADVGERAVSAMCDLIVVDLAAKGFDPLRVIANLRTARATRHLPLLALAAPAAPDIAKRAIELGADDMLGQPLDAAEATTRMRTLVRRKRLADRLRDNLHLSIRLATTDPLTGLYNRHYVLCHLSTLMQRANQTRRPLSVALIDVDHFKKINDTWGHSAGDTVLRHIGERLALNVRGVDLAGRYGGEEFIVVMPDTDAETAKMIAQRLCAVIAEHKFPCRPAEDDAPIALTVSIGLACLSPHDDAAGRQIIDRADAALYRAKHEGRNRVVMSAETETAG
jgi:two-component system, cell cycle response regulator